MRTAPFFFCGLMTEMEASHPYPDERLKSAFNDKYGARIRSNPTLNTDLHLPDLIYHYTSNAGLKGILESQCFWATHYGSLNDSTEFQHGLRLVTEVLATANWMDRRLRLALENVESTPQIITPYVACFCGKRDQPSQWRNYGCRGHGYALGLRSERLRDAAWKTGAGFHRVIYERGSQRELFTAVLKGGSEALSEIPRGLSDERGLIRCALNSCLSDLIPLAVSMKDSSYQSEDEWRIVQPDSAEHPKANVKHRKSSSGDDVPYVEIRMPDPTTGKLPLVEVILGPKLNLEKERPSIVRLLKNAGCDSQVTVSCSEVRW